MRASAKHRGKLDEHIRKNNKRDAGQDCAKRDTRANNCPDDKNIRNKRDDGNCMSNGYKPPDDTKNNTTDAKRVAMLQRL